MLYCQQMQGLCTTQSKSIFDKRFYVFYKIGYIQSFKNDENRYDCEGIASSIKGNYSELYHFYDLSRGPNPYFSTPVEYSFHKDEIAHIVV